MNKNFDDILLEILDEFIDNKNVDIEAYCKKYPQYKENILAKFRVAEFLKNSFQEEEISGKNLGEYLILRELARGGMGIVFLAIHPALSRLTAIKILPPSFARDKETLKNFQEEAKTIAKFNHPNIAPIYSISSERGVYYIAMGYISGISLKDLIKKLEENKNTAKIKATAIRGLLHVPSEKKDISQKSISLKRDLKFWDKSYYQFVATVGAEVADALNYAHQNGISHGDIKPSNILLTNEGMPMIVDFGLSKDARKLSTSKSTEFTGTLAYVAPEQIKDNTINGKTDIWSLGVTLYELLTFKNPFGDNTVKKTVNKILKSEATPLRALNKKIPVELEAIVLKCLEKNPENRYNTTLELSQDLNNYIESKPIKAKPITVIGRTKKWAKRHPFLASFIIIFFLASLSLTFLSYKLKVNRLVDAGIELQHSHKFEDAEKSFSKALELTANIPFMATVREKALLGLASLNSSKQPKVSLEFFKQCLTVNPNNIDALCGMGYVYETLGNYTEAVTYYKQAVSVSPNHAFASLNLAESLDKLGLIDEARKCHEDFLKNNPNNVSVKEDYSRFLRNHNKMTDVLILWSKNCTIDTLKKDSVMQWEVCSSLENLIKSSANTDSPISTPDRAKILLVSAGFDDKCSAYIIEQYNQTYGIYISTRNVPTITPSKMKQLFENMKRQYKEKGKE